MNRLAIALLSAVTIATSALADTESTIQDIKSVLPNGWELNLRTNAVALRGVGAPSFGIDLVNMNTQLDVWFSEEKNVHINPSFTLFFYPRDQEQQINKAIEQEQFRSDYPPIYFALTPEFVVLTTPGMINRGVHTEEADKSIESVTETLREHWRNDSSNQAFRRKK